MNEIAAQLGEVGLPAPISELAAKDWDVIVVGGGHNGLTAAAYLARAGKSVLVLERRERLGGACTLERPFEDERFVISPLRLRGRPARRRRDRRAPAAPARPQVLDGRSEPLGPVRGRDLLRAVPRRRADPAEPRRARDLEEGHRRLLGLRGALRRRPQAASQGRPRHLDRRHADPGRDRGDPRRRPGEDRPRLRGLDRRRPRPLHRGRAPQDRALRPGRDRHLGRAVRSRHRLDQAHALPGRHGRSGSGLGLRRGRHGDGLVRDRRRRPRGRRDARLRRPGRRDHAR